MAGKVTLRTKQIAGNRLSLYLDYYPAVQKNGRRTRREFLKKYLYSDFGINELGKKTKIRLSPQMKRHNVEMLKIARQIESSRQNELDKPEIYSRFENEQLKKIETEKRDFVDFFEQLMETKTGKNYMQWNAVLQYLKSYSNESARFKDVTVEFCEGFKKYLLSSSSIKSKKRKLAHNTACSYFNKFQEALKHASKLGYISDVLRENIKSIPYKDPPRNYLTIEELNLLIQTPCNNELLKRASIFSALTGLRFSDIVNLRWQNLQENIGGKTAVSFIVEKTGEAITHYISKQALSLLGERADPTEQIFKGLSYSAYGNKDLYQWIGAAGITKNITFHCFRHTYATLQLSGGTDIYTLSKLLGHKSIKTTQIYAKVVDELKQQAADRIQLHFK